MASRNRDIQQTVPNPTLRRQDGVIMESEADSRLDVRRTRLRPGAGASARRGHDPWRCVAVVRGLGFRVRLATPAGPPAQALHGILWRDPAPRHDDRRRVVRRFVRRRSGRDRRRRVQRGGSRRNRDGSSRVVVVFDVFGGSGTFDVVFANPPCPGFSRLGQAGAKDQRSPRSTTSTPLDDGSRR